MTPLGTAGMGGEVWIHLASLSDIDKVMINLKTEEFVLEMTTLQSLQQLIQWVGDFVLYLLASLPNQVRAGVGKTSGYAAWVALASNPGALSKRALRRRVRNCRKTVLSVPSWASAVQ